MLQRNSLGSSRLAFAAAIALVAVACGDEVTSEAPTLLALQAAEVAVNSTLRLPLVVENPAGVALTFSMSGPALPGLDEVTQLGGTPTGGLFQWTPLASHVGNHEFTFTVSSSQGGNSQSVLIHVTASESAAPIFLRPGSGGTFDLSVDPCVTVDIEVRDDDSSSVEITTRTEPPPGSAVVTTGSKQAQFQWCPAQAQIAQSERWTLELEADDGDHTPTTHDFLIVLRTTARDNCPGTPPTITVNSPSGGQRVESGGAYSVDIEVDDDTGVRDAPLLYYSTVEPEETDDPDITSFDQATFSGSGRSWEAEIPSLGLLEGEERTVYYVVSVTDNDDESGTSCDHRTETNLRNFIAVGASETVRIGLCESCGDSERCESRVCAASAGGARCLQACAEGDSCDEGACRSVNTIEGLSTLACGDVIAACEGGGPEECINDEYELNDTYDESAYISSSPIFATICAADIDYFDIDVDVDSEIEIILDQFDQDTADLDLELLDATGERIAGSAGTSGTERVTHCLAGGEFAVIRVYAYHLDDQSDYRLRIETDDGDCCIDDIDEPDDTFEDAWSVELDGSFEGTICPGNEDWVWFDVNEPSHLTATIIFTHSEADLDLELYDPEARRVSSSLGASDDETIEIDLSVTGDYSLRIFPYGDGSTDYLGEVILEPLSSCDSSDDCPIGTVCDDGSCDTDICTSASSCPEDYMCPSAGPGGGDRHCAAPCTVNGDCRDEGIVEESCKRLPEGLGCGLRGSAANGEPCGGHNDCGGQRACIDWPSGYCARASCTSDSDCESDTFCSDECLVDGEILGLCVRRCGPGFEDTPCRGGYECQFVFDMYFEFQAACVPAECID
jgi:hypothetical protein